MELLVTELCPIEPYNEFSDTLNLRGAFLTEQIVKTMFRCGLFR